MPIYTDRQAKWQGSIHAQGCGCGYGYGVLVLVLLLVLCSAWEPDTPPYCVLRARWARRVFHDTCCIIAL